MEILILWVGSIVASISMESAQVFKLFKDIADEGYKIDIEKLSEFSEELNKVNPNSSKQLFLEFLLPIYNMSMVLVRAIEYSQERSNIVNQLILMDCIEAMIRFEYEEYKKNPTGLNAIVVPLRFKDRISKAQSLKIINGFEKSEIFYEIGRSSDDIIILKVEGKAKLLTIDQQKQKIKEYLKDIDENDGCINKILNNDLYEVNSECETSKKTSIDEQKKGLEKLKRELNEKSKNDDKKLKIKRK